MNRRWISFSGAFLVVGLAACSGGDEPGDVVDDTEGAATALSPGEVSIPNAKDAKGIALGSGELLSMGTKAILSSKIKARTPETLKKDLSLDGGYWALMKEQKGILFVAMKRLQDSTWMAVRRDGTMVIPPSTTKQVLAIAPDPAGKSMYGVLWNTGWTDNSLVRLNAQGQWDTVYTPPSGCFVEDVVVDATQAFAFGYCTQKVQAPDRERTVLLRTIQAIDVNTKAAKRIELGKIDDLSSLGRFRGVTQEGDTLYYLADDHKNAFDLPSGLVVRSMKKDGSKATTIAKTTGPSYLESNAPIAISPTHVQYLRVKGNEETSEASVCKVPKTGGTEDCYAKWTSERRGRTISEAELRVDQGKVWVGVRENTNDMEVKNDPSKLRLFQFPW